MYHSVDSARVITVYHSSDIFSFSVALLSPVLSTVLLCYIPTSFEVPSGTTSAAGFILSSIPEKKKGSLDFKLPCKKGVPRFQDRV